MERDLDIILKKKNSVFFTGHKDKVRYEIDMFIPAGVSLIVARSRKEDGGVTEEKGLKFQIETLECFLTHQHEHMSKEWIEDNMSLDVQNLLFRSVLQDIQKSNTLLISEPEELKNGMEKGMPN